MSEKLRRRIHGQEEYRRTGIETAFFTTSLLLLSLAVFLVLIGEFFSAR